MTEYASPELRAEVPILFGDASEVGRYVPKRRLMKNVDALTNLINEALKAYHAAKETGKPEPLIVIRNYMQEIAPKVRLVSDGLSRLPNLNKQELEKIDKLLSTEEEWLKEMEAYLNDNLERSKDAA